MQETTLIIANDMQQAQYVRRRLSTVGGKPYFTLGRVGSCPMLPPLPHDTMIETTPAGALQAMAGRRPKRIIIVDYTQWRGPIAQIWTMILAQKANGAQVVWW